VAVQLKGGGQSLADVLLVLGNKNAVLH
jgi:hypothetical protein